MRASSLGRNESNKYLGFQMELGVGKEAHETSNDDYM
jgi:hypothetical protein